MDSLEGPFGNMTILQVEMVMGKGVYRTDLNEILAVYNDPVNLRKNVEPQTRGLRTLILLLVDERSINDFVSLHIFAPGNWHFIYSGLINVFTIRVEKIQ